jgi:hypothetical protein
MADGQDFICGVKCNIHGDKCIFVSNGTIIWSKRFNCAYSRFMVPELYRGALRVTVHEMCVCYAVFYVQSVLRH